MARFRYKAASAAGDILEGEIEAPSRVVAVEGLRRKGHLPIRVEPLTGGTPSRSVRPAGRRSERLPPREIALLTRELATLLQAGLPLDRSLALILEMTEHPALRKFIERLMQSVRGGVSLAQALEPERHRLPAIYVGMVSAGEAGGSLAPVLARLADALEQAEKLKETVRSALAYPALVLLVATGSLVVLLTVVLPEFRPLFESSGAELPTSTAVLIAVGEGLSRYWWALALLVLVIGLAVSAHNRTPEGRLRRDRIVLDAPLLGDVVRKNEVARFCRTLGTLSGNGVPILEALRIAGDAVANQVIAEAIRALGQQLRRGERMAPHLAHSRIFPRMAVQLVQVGEESGELSQMLLRVSEIYDEEVKRSLQRMVSMLVPAITIGLGLLVAAIVATMLTAILGTYDLTM
ncbi:MAG: Type secretion system domain protein [Rhodospirillales bacterium]|jgi:general secretion pathway protein F|nr:Type secretion system domain protein [Rhodospirillales bacterium]